MLHVRKAEAEEANIVKCGVCPNNLSFFNASNAEPELTVFARRKSPSPESESKSLFTLPIADSPTNDG